MKHLLKIYPHHPSPLPQEEREEVRGVP